MSMPAKAGTKAGMTPTQETDGPLVTVTRAGELLHCGRSRIFELLADGRLERGPKLGRATVVRLDSVMALIQEGLPPKSQPPKRRKVRPSRGQLAAELRAAVARATGAAE
jgi:hypothetical protein